MDIVAPVGKAWTKVFGSRNDRLIKKYHRRVDGINALEGEVRPLSDGELRDRAADLRRRIGEAGHVSEDALHEGFAIMRESLDRNVGIRNIFNPAHKREFPLEELSAGDRALYEGVEAEIAELEPEPVPGGEEPAPGWLRVDVPARLYEAVREVYPESRPPFRTRPFDVQLIGGMVLYEGRIAEMKTGEGKTIVAPLACFMAAIEGLRCHVVTVNDYLVQRDRDWVFPAFYKLGMSVGAIHPFHMQRAEKKQEAYGCDVVYGTNSEFGFDYLRDNMKLSVREQVQKSRDFCIVDEIDSILIDEARTPLIISGPAHDDAPQYLRANEVAEKLVALQHGENAKTLQRVRSEGFAREVAGAARVPEAQVQKLVAKFRDLGADYLSEKDAELIGHTQYYVVKKDQKLAYMTPLGVEEAQKIIGTRFYVVGNDMAWDHLINQALRAHAVYEKDREYVVQNGEVVIVDEFTGRLMVGRQWSDGLHQAVEAKESKHGVKIKQESQTLATITIQNFFKLYKRLAGMTGTAITEATEFDNIYGLDVVCIPTNRPVVRQDFEDLVYLNEGAKWGAILEEVRSHAEAGRPVLVGTTSVEKSEYLAGLLAKKHGLEHEVLNAKQHEREAHVIEKAGQQHGDKRKRVVGNVTIATNMAGRGTDIKLTPEVVEAGGLHIVGTERHEARRIDNQLRGRAGRQGDPGSSRFFISMEDDLMKMFAGKSTMKALSMLGMKEEDAIEHRWITRSVERAQRKVEERNFQMRKSLLEYDEVMEYQRNSFYGARQAALEGREIKRTVLDYLAESIEDAVARYLDPMYIPEQLSEAVRSVVGVGIDASKLRGESLEEIEPVIRSDAKADMRQEIEVTVGEYMSEETEPETWDLKGLSSWAMSRFSADMKQSYLREHSPAEVTERLTELAHGLIEKKPLDALGKFFEPHYVQNELAAWARNKFGLELTVAELSPTQNERLGDAEQRIAELIYERAEAAYKRREIDYPVSFVLEVAFGTAQQGPEGSAWAAEQIARWARYRCGLEWDAERVTRMNGEEIGRALTDELERWHGPKLDEWIEAALRGHPDDGALIERFRERWGVTLDGEALAACEDDGARAALVRGRAEGLLRWELAQLEQYVLLQILDQTWKDHLYAMDQLKDSIGLRGFGEKDPKIEYKREGARYFQEMLVAVRDKVTDVIFKARLTPRVEMQNVYANQRAEHEAPRGTGVAASEEQLADQRAAERAGAGERQVTATIVNKGPSVGRNDPCPCGSGRKYKKCCGANG